MMKNILKYIAGAAAVAALAGCSLNPLPSFDDADAFVALDKTKISVNEDAGTVSIPMTIASTTAKKTVVSYELIDGASDDDQNPAKQGVNYEGADESAVVSFDGEARTGSIVVNIKELAGTYTGDLSFRVKLVSATGLNLGADSECTITIADKDHPLASILGKYKATAEDKGNGSCEWELTLSKDSKDVSIVWIDYICPFAASYPSMTWDVYGIVSDDLKTITIPCGQKPGAMYAADDPFTFIWFNYDSGYYTRESGNVTMTSTEEGVFTTEDGMGFVSTDYVWKGAMLLKGTAKWTKE